MPNRRWTPERDEALANAADSDDQFPAYVEWRGKKLIRLKDNIYWTRQFHNGNPMRHYFVKTKCASCDAVVYANKSNFDSNVHGKSFCDKDCKAAWFSGPRNWNWSGEKKTKHGRSENYILVYAPDHPNARNGHVVEHRLVVEKHIGRLLNADEVVHHIDCNPTNNKIENLVITDQATHRKAHGSINKCVRKLMNSPGILKFNRDTMTYEVA